MTDYPKHDLRALRNRTVSLLAGLDTLAKHLEKPSDATEVDDLEAVVRWKGKPYRVTGSVQTPGTDRITIYIEPKVKEAT